MLNLVDRLHLLELVCIKRQSDCEGGSLSGPAHIIDGSAVCGNDLFNDRQTESGAVGLCRGKKMEDIHAGRNTDSGIAYLEDG